MKATENKHFIFERETNIDLKYRLRYIYNTIGCSIIKQAYRFLVPKEKKEHKYNVSICAYFKDEAAYMKEWIEFHKIVGVEHFYLYNNKSSDNYMEVLKPYIDEGTVSLKDWPKPQSQMEAYQDFIDNDSHETQWVGFIDLDEFVVPNKHDSIKDFLEGFRNRPAVVIYWKQFGTSGRMDRDVNGLLTEDFTSCWYKFTDVGKFFFNTDYKYIDGYKRNYHMHFQWAETRGIKLPPVNVFDRVCLKSFHRIPNDDMPIQVNHYAIKSYKEYIDKKAKRGGGVNPNGVHDLSYFLKHETKCTSTDHHAYKYLIKLKLAMGIDK